MACVLNSNFNTHPYTSIWMDVYACKIIIIPINIQQAWGRRNLMTSYHTMQGEIATEVEMMRNYHTAEEYHQEYLAKGGRFGQPQDPSKGCNDPIRCYG